VSGTLEHWLQQRWYGGEAPGLGLRALAGLYRGGRALAQRGIDQQRVEAPVIVVGNFTAGGTGKTPLVIALARWLAAAGRAPAILSRGHGRQGRGAVRVEADTPVADCGDEPKHMFEAAGVPVFVDADRVAAARAAITAGARVLLCDDGLQHLRLGRDIEVEVVDGARGYGNGLLLPAGPLREAPRRCDFRVVTGEPAPGVLAPGSWVMRLQPLPARPLSLAGPPRGLESFRNAPVDAVAAIGNPERFFAMLRTHRLDLRTHAFPDHHAYCAGDFAAMPGPILMTSKDAVKCRRLGLADAWEVGVEPALDPGFFAAVAQRLDAIDARA
jgi:tetraacyldisaccharide 4'-kinase